MVRIQGALPERYIAASQEELAGWIGGAKAELGDRLLILGHHYQRDEVIRWADARGDSLKLARYAAENDWASDIVFCGVHFMAESADVLTGPDQRVVLPDLNAGCSMADMADADEVEECWEALAGVIDADRVVPITYVNSSAAVKAFVGRHGGACCTSSNARGVLTWALERGDRVLFVPDQHLGRNTALAMGYPAEEMRVWNPRFEQGGLEDREIKDSRFLVWKGHCSVHQRFTPAHVAVARAEHPGVSVIVHPECAHEVVALADQVGSTEQILAWVDEAPAGAVVAVGTEIHMVRRMAADHPDKTIFSLDPLICPCSTMFRIDEPHLAWCLESLARGGIVNQITVDPETAAGARLALAQMLEIS